jgi:hypothetical protein
VWKLGLVTDDRADNHEYRRYDYGVGKSRRRRSCLDQAQRHRSIQGSDEPRRVPSRQDNDGKSPFQPNPRRRSHERYSPYLQITSCVQRSKPIDTFPSQTGWVASAISEENAANRLTLICIDLPSIRARANALTQNPYNPAQHSDAQHILEFAQLVDANLQVWHQTLPPEWHYRTVAMVYHIPDDVSTAGSWVGPQHAYHDVSLASIVNDYRVCRIFCQRVIMACVSWMSYGGENSVATEAWNNALFVVQQMVDDISASVTFHMSYDMQPIAQQLGQERNGEFSITSLFPSQAEMGQSVQVNEYC